MHAFIYKIYVLSGPKWTTNIAVVVWLSEGLWDGFGLLATSIKSESAARRIAQHCHTKWKMGSFLGDVQRKQPSWLLHALSAQLTCECSLETCLGMVQILNNFAQLPSVEFECGSLAFPATTFAPMRDELGKSFFFCQQTQQNQSSATNIVS